jgi:glutamate racemase
MTTAISSADWPIGVFDSGVGGLSILSALQTQMPNEAFLYLADSAFAPYGERDEQFVLQRAQAALRLLNDKHPIKALVVACNTATALAIHVLRQQHPQLPIFGVEPAVKPAASQSRTRRVGVIATAGTLGSQKFADLLRGQGSETTFVTQACDGLAEAIEQQWQQTNNLTVMGLCEKYLSQMGAFGTGPGELDTLVLGCTHYPFARKELLAVTGPAVQLFETGAPVARRVHHILAERQLLREKPMGQLTLMATRETLNLQQAAKHWLSIDTVVCSA